MSALLIASHVWTPLIAGLGNGFGVIIMIIGVLIFAAVAAGRQWYENKRTLKLKELADELGLSFAAKDPPIAQQLGQFYLCSLGRGRKLTNAIHGETNDVELAIFDYRYTIGSGKNARTYRQSVISIQSADLAVPRFLVRPRKSFLRWTLFGSKSSFACKDIKFDDATEFSTEFLVRGDDEEQVTRLLDPNIRSLIKSHGTMTIEGSGPQLLVYRNKMRVQPEDLKKFLQTGFEIFTTIRATTADE